MPKNQNIWAFRRRIVRNKKQMTKKEKDCERFFKKIKNLRIIEKFPNIYMINKR